MFFEKVAAPRCGMCGTNNQHKSNIVLNTVASASESSEESSHNERGTLCFATDVYEAGNRSTAGSTACIAGIVPLGRTLRCRRLCLLARLGEGVSQSGGDPAIVAVAVMDGMEGIVRTAGLARRERVL